MYVQYDDARKISYKNCRSNSTALTTANSRSPVPDLGGSRTTNVSTTTDFLRNLPPIAIAAPAVAKTRATSGNPKSSSPQSNVPKLPDIRQSANGHSSMTPTSGILAGLDTRLGDHQRRHRGKKPNKFTADSHPDQVRDDPIFEINHA